MLFVVKGDPKIVSRPLLLLNYFSKGALVGVDHRSTPLPCATTEVNRDRVHFCSNFLSRKLSTLVSIRSRYSRVYSDDT